MRSVDLLQEIERQERRSRENRGSVVLQGLLREMFEELKRQEEDRAWAAHDRRMARRGGRHYGK